MLIDTNKEYASRIRKMEDLYERGNRMMQSNLRFAEKSEAMTDKTSSDSPNNVMRDSFKTEKKKGAVAE